MDDRIRIATAGWSMPAASPAGAGPDVRPPSALVRYANLLGATEINSSFYRHHRPATYDRWALDVPMDFRFSVKLPKAITHAAQLEPAASVPILERFLTEVANLRFKLGPVLVQLPPSLRFDERVAAGFLRELRDRHDGQVACEPRHPSWFGTDAEALLVAHRVARVAADPARVPAAAEAGGWTGLAYVRLHGSPRTYYSSYTDEHLDELAARVRALAAGAAEEVWCVFDNTASGAALDNALGLRDRLGGRAVTTRG